MCILLPALAVQRAQSSEQAEELRCDQLNAVCELDGEILGEGSFGRVMRARLRATGQDCAVKVVPKISPSVAKQARGEAAVLRQLNHKHICALLDAFEDDDNVYLALELLGNRDLFDELNVQRWMVTDRQAAALVRQLLAALEHCHERRLAHRDVKAENLMLVGAGLDARLKLIDFGLAAKCTSDQLLHLDVEGTAGYLAPEGVAGKFSHASDMWAVGALLHQLLAGPAVPVTVGAQALRDLPGVHRDALSLAAALLSAEPAARPTAQEALASAWLEF